jgi:drug/metabolite transporter (DMT)-like permease
MNEQLTPGQFALLCAYAVGLATGQLLFKLASPSVAGTDPMVARLLALLQNGYFIAALAAYLVLAVLWVWILSFTPISRAYSFVALSLAITPVLGAIMFSEPLSSRLLIGIGIILCGLFLVAG